MLSYSDALVIFMCLALPCMFIVTGLPSSFSDLIIPVVLWATYFALAVTCISACDALWHIAHSLDNLSQRDTTTNMHPLVLTLSEIKDEIKQLTTAMSLARRCR
jgi:hypothetical protein